MSEPAEFNVTLHHLAPDAKRAGAEFPDQDLLRVKASHLRQLIESLATIAPTAIFPVEPEVRIAGPHGRFLVQAKNGKVKVISWSSQTGTGGEMTPDRIVAMIMGMEQPPPEPPPTGLAGALALLSERGKLIMLALAILGSNAVTAWFVTRPPPPPPKEILPDYRPVAADQAKRLFDEFAGEYESGTGAARRQLTIARDGELRWVKFGENDAVEDDAKLTAKAAESRGHPVLVASNYGMIELKDPITVLYFGDSYRRRVTAHEQR